MDTQMEERLWDFIDGMSDPDEQLLIRQLIAEDPAWRRRHNELMTVDQAMQHHELEAPSLRFTKNVMEQIARHHVAPATKTYINKNVIRGITAFFLIMIIGILIYFFGQFHWTSTSTDNLIPQYTIDANKLNWGKALNNTYVNVFILINVVLGFILLDKYLQNRKKSERVDG
jgi:ribosomal protein L32